MAKFLPLILVLKECAIIRRGLSFRLLFFILFCSCWQAIDCLSFYSIYLSVVIGRKSILHISKWNWVADALYGCDESKLNNFQIENFCNWTVWSIGNFCGQTLNDLKSKQETENLLFFLKKSWNVHSSGWYNKIIIKDKYSEMKKKLLDKVLDNFAFYLSNLYTKFSYTFTFWPKLKKNGPEFFGAWSSVININLFNFTKKQWDVKNKKTEFNFDVTSAVNVDWSCCFKFWIV